MVKTMFDRVAPRYDLVNRVISMGMDIGWRKRTLKALALPAGSTVLDLACGTGDLSRMLTARGIEPVGLDISTGMLRASRRGQSDKLAMVPVLGDAATLPFRNGIFDGVVCGFGLRNFTDLEIVFAEIARVTRPGGRVALLEVAIPSSAIIRTGFKLWFERAVPVIGSLLSDPTAYRYLPDSVEYLPDPEVLKSLLRSSGLRSVGRRTFSAGSTQLLTATRSGEILR